MRVSENHTLEILEKLRDGGRASLSGILGDVSVDAEPRCDEPPGSLSNSHVGLAHHVSDDVTDSPLRAERRGIPLLGCECLEELQETLAYLVHFGPDIGHGGHE